MTNQERAQKILHIVQEEYGSGCIGRIQAQLDEAVREARQDGTFHGGHDLLDLQKAYKRGRSEGFSAAREQLAKRAEVNGMAGCYLTGKEIRAMTPDEGRDKREIKWNTNV